MYFTPPAIVNLENADKAFGDKCFTNVTYNSVRREGKISDGNCEIKLLLKSLKKNGRKGYHVLPTLIICLVLLKSLPDSLPEMIGEQISI